jgi:hypothetical protein
VSTSLPGFDNLWLNRIVIVELQLLKVVSPAAGIVATPSRQLKEMKRQMVNKGDLIAKVKVFDFKTVIAEMIE